MQPRMSVFDGLGPALRRLREAARLTQAEVAARSGISQSRLSHYENGRRLPGLTTLDRLLICYAADAEALGRALKEAHGAPPVPASDPELMARVRDALAELGYSKPFPEPKT